MNSNAGGKAGNDVATNYGTIPMVDNEKIPNYRKSTFHSNHNSNSNNGGGNNNNTSEVERLLPELLVMEIHRDGSHAVTYRHYTIRGLYRYVLDAIADRTGILQAAAYYQLWQKKTIKAANSRESGEMGPTATTATNTTSTSSSDNLEPQGTVPAEMARDGVSTSLETPAESSTMEDSTIPNMSTTDPPADQPVPATQSMGPDLTTSSTHNAQPHTSAHEGGQNSNVTYRERLGGYLHPRDMRRLVTPFSTSNEPEIIVRRHVILINYDPLRTIILRDRLLVLVPNGADSLLSKLELRVRGNSSREDMENTIFGTNMDHNDTASHSTSKETPTTKKATETAGKSRVDRTFLNKKSASNTSSDDCNVDVDAETKTVATDHVPDDDDDMDEWHEMAAREWVNLPFELQCTDAVLYVVGSILQEETIEVQEAAQSFIERIVKHGGAGLEDDPLTIIRVVKDAVQLMSNRVKSYVQSIHRLLDDDEDMALMNLSRLLSHPERFVQPVPQRILNEESDEPELILESNLQIGLTLVNYLEVIQGQIHTAKELIDQRLDATRNKLLFANMLISVFTLCVTLGALVGSFFGMNLELPGGLAEDDFAFNQVVAYTCIGCLVICALIMIALLYTDTIPFRLSRRFRPVRINV